MPSGEDSRLFAEQAKGIFEGALHSGEINPLAMRGLLHLPGESLVAAIDGIGEERGLSEGESEYLAFLVNLRRYHYSWHDPEAVGSLWSVIGEREGPTMVFVETSEKRRVGDFGISVCSKGDFKGKYPDKLKDIFESMEEDEMTVKYTDEEYTKKYGINFAGAFKIRRPSDEDEGEISHLMGVIPPLLGMDDPVSMAQEERTGAVDMGSFFGAGTGNVMEAYERLRPHEMGPLQKDLFEFAMRVRGLYNRWQGDLEPFSHFEEGEPKKMLRVDFGPSNVGGTPMMFPLTADSIRDSMEGSDDEGFKSMASDSIDLLEQDVVTEDVVVMVFYDEFMTQRHGFPFDMLMLLEGD